MDVSDMEYEIEKNLVEESNAPCVGSYKYLMTESGFRFFREIETDDDVKTVIGGYEKTLDGIRSTIERIKQGTEIEWDEAVNSLNKIGVSLENSIALYNQHPESEKQVRVIVSIFYPEEGDEDFYFEQYQYDITDLSLKFFTQEVETFSASNVLTERGSKHYFTKELCKTLFQRLDVHKTKHRACEHSKDEHQFEM